jgi:hypothetical protein
VSPNHIYLNELAIKRLGVRRDAWHTEKDIRSPGRMVATIRKAAGALQMNY